MAFFPISGNGEGSGRANIGVEYNDRTNALEGLFFQGTVTRDLIVTIHYHYDLEDGQGTRRGEFGPFNARDLLSGQLVDLSGLGLVMQELPAGEDTEGDGPPAGTIGLSLPAGFKSLGVTWG